MEQYLLQECIIFVFSCLFMMLTYWQEYELTRLKVKKIQEDIRHHPRNLQKDPQNQLTRGDRELQLQFKPCIHLLFWPESPPR